MTRPGSFDTDDYDVSGQRPTAVPQPAPTLIADDPRTAAVAEMIAPTVEDLGYELVRVHLSSAAPPTLQVMVERADRAGMTVDHCAEVSRAVSAILDVEDPISGAYTLEVSSPGIDRPLTRADDFDRFAGFEAKLETRQPIDGRRRFRGRLDGLAGEAGDAVAMRVEQDGEQIAVAIPLAAIHRAKLVLTDDLIEASGG